MKKIFLEWSRLTKLKEIVKVHFRYVLHAYSSVLSVCSPSLVVVFLLFAADISDSIKLLTSTMEVKMVNDYNNDRCRILIFIYIYCLLVFYLWL